MRRIPAAYQAPSFLRRLRRYFLVGLIVMAPVGLTGFVLAWVFRRLDRILGVPLGRALPVQIPGLGFVLLAIFVVLVGWVVHLAAGRQLLQWWNTQLVRFPLTGRIYNAVSQIVQSVVGGRRKLFLRTVLVPYPTDDLWAVAFVTSDDAPETSRLVGEPCVNVFVPTTPNPTSGFMLIAPKRRVIDIDVSVEEAMKLIISGGSVSPSGPMTPAIRRGLDVESLFRSQGD